MIDKEFELISESARLMTNDGYFGRFWELQPQIGVYNAYKQLESELPMGLERYTSFHSFEVAKKKYKDGTLPDTIIFKFKPV